LPSAPARCSLADDPRKQEDRMASDIARLNDLGQSPWYDNLARSLLTDGGLARLVQDDGIRGVTSNPTIFEKAMGTGDVYDEGLRSCAAKGLSIEESYWQLVVEDVGHAADLLRPVYDTTSGGDGFVSVEVSPDLAHDTAGTINQAKELFARLARPNVMIKIPATIEGLDAIAATIAAGINVNVTLIFALARHGAVIDAYLDGLDKLVTAGGDLATVSSVASFFVSRVDTETDRRLPEGHPLRGKAAVANAKLAYRLFEERFAGDRWNALAAKGARLQRPLWASTSKKNPDYSATLYIDELIGAHTVNTLAPASIDALHAGDAHLEADPVKRDVDGAQRVIDDLAGAGVDFDDVTATLEREGVDSFAGSFHDAFNTLEKKRAEVTT
jgi:transaldolase